MTMRNRSLSGNVGIGVFFLAFVCICVAFGTPGWLVSDARISGAKLWKLGLWAHCFRSLPDPRYRIERTYVGCRWIFDPFTVGYSEIRGYLIPDFMIAVQFFFTLCFLISLVAFGLILFYFLCSNPEQEKYVQLIYGIGLMLLVAGICGCIAIIVFACLGNTDNWMPGHVNNFFGYSFVTGAVGSVLLIINSILFFSERHVQMKKRKYMRESQTRFPMETKN